MDQNIHITPLRVPADLVRDCPGFALDMGSSAVKIVCRTKDDWQHVVNNKDASHATLHCIGCSRANLPAALQVVRDRGHLTRDDRGKARVVTCGMGGYEFHDLIAETLNVSITNVFESPLLFDALRYMLERCATADVVYPYLREDENLALVEAQKRRESIKHLYKSGRANFPCEEKEKQAEFVLDAQKSLSELVGLDNVYPCLYFILGSGFGGVKAFVFFQLVSPNGVTEAIPCTGNSTGGKFVMGIASLLTGCKSYDEFMDMAEKGDSRPLDVTRSTIVSSMSTKPKNISEDDPYKKFLEMDTGDDEMVFNFGQAMFQNLENYKKEDIAASWLRSQVTDIASNVYAVARQAGVRYIFIGGSFPAREIVRKQITQEFVKFRLKFHQFQKEGDVEPEIHFLKNGGHLSAIGGMLKAANDNKAK